MALPEIVPVDPETIAAHIFHLREQCPLVHCLTNDVVQEITANVLLAASASPAMVIACEEVSEFARKSDALLVNVGTPLPDRVEAMHLAINSASRHDIPWVLDPVAAGVISWRDKVIHGLLAKKPAAIRANASEILALAGAGSGGRGVDSADSSESALEAAAGLSLKTGAVVCVTGAVDYATDGKRIYSVKGGSVRSTMVVGTGCSLSALVAAFIAGTDHRLEAVISACAYAKRAAEMAAGVSSGPGTFRSAYIDALNMIDPRDFY